VIGRCGGFLDSEAQQKLDDLVEHVLAHPASEPEGVA
jgi:hypothetical protein